MLQSAIVSKEDLKTEMINGRPVQFGEYNFTDIELDTDLIPSVIPIETARDGRCLCETENGCSCLAADWKPVKLTSKLSINFMSFVLIFIEVEKPPPPSNTTLESENKTKVSPITNTLHWWVHSERKELEHLNSRHSFAVLGTTTIVFTFVFLFCFGLKCYRRIQKAKKASNVQLMNEPPSYFNSGAIPLIMQRKLSLFSADSLD